MTAGPTQCRQIFMTYELRNSAQTHTTRVYIYTHTPHRDGLDAKGNGEAA